MFFSSHNTSSYPPTPHHHHQASWWEPPSQIYCIMFRLFAEQNGRKSHIFIEKSSFYEGRFQMLSRIYIFRFPWQPLFTLNIPPGSHDPTCGGRARPEKGRREGKHPNLDVLMNVSECESSLLYHTLTEGGALFKSEIYLWLS